MISNVNLLSENRSVAFLAISGALAGGALGGPHTPGQVGALCGPQTRAQHFQFISHRSSIIPDVGPLYPIIFLQGFNIIHFSSVILSWDFISI